MKRAHPLTQQGLPILLLIIAMGCLCIGYFLTHHQERRLMQRIDERHKQLQQHQQRQQFLAKHSAGTSDAIQFSWQLGAWADAMALPLILQPLNNKQSVISATVKGEQEKLQQLLQLTAQLSATERWQNSWRSQLLSWRLDAAGQHRLQWQLTTDALQQALSPPGDFDNDFPANCAEPPLQNSSTSQRFADLRLIAIIQRNAGSQDGIAYWRNTDNKQLRTIVGDSFSEPLTIITAITPDHVALNQWSNVSDCWLLTTKHIKL